MYVKNEEEFPCPVCNSFSVQNICEVGLVPTKSSFLSKYRRCTTFCMLAQCLCLSWGRRKFT